jgi:hypothetical protein
MRLSPCPCPACRRGPHPERERHQQLRAVLQRMDEAQRRWVAALEAMRLGYGGTRKVAQITELAEKTIRRGRDEVRHQLRSCPPARVRRPGAGRPTAEKNFRALNLP